MLPDGSPENPRPVYAADNEDGRRHENIPLDILRYVSTYFACTWGWFAIKKFRRRFQKEPMRNTTTLLGPAEVGSAHALPFACPFRNPKSKIRNPKSDISPFRIPCSEIKYFRIPTSQFHILCPLPSDLCFLPSALCPMPYARDHLRNSHLNSAG